MLLLLSNQGVFSITVLPDSSFEEVVSVLITKSDSMTHIESRRLSSRSRRSFKLTYSNISIDEYSNIENYFIYNIGRVVEFTHPESSITYNAVLSNDTLDKTWVTSRLLNTSLTFETI